jgi:hypothetical protein
LAAHLGLEKMKMVAMAWREVKPTPWDYNKDRLESFSDGQWQFVINWDALEVEVVKASASSEMTGQRVQFQELIDHFGDGGETAHYLHEIEIPQSVLDGSGPLFALLGDGVNSPPRWTESIDGTGRRAMASTSGSFASSARKRSPSRPPRARRPEG